ncbi:hypothetical protein CVT24_005223 [Panaeolus cyanescens]|uniref:HNH nuclease domain-containing protein n=1 Tax=Panaeolus cyanescens TaxID=181874 RepID=A0A409Y925_9AGAR|nr:hypothetical protein CVT24_005223 [Panaeolus cyanescens]
MELILKEITSFAIKRAQNADLNLQRCLIENCSSSGAVQLAHVLGRETSASERTVTPLEWNWDLMKGSLNLDTRRNIFFLAPSIYELYKDRRWSLIPEEDVVYVYISRQSEDETVAIHEYPFADFPVVTSHVHPVFVLLHLADALLSVSQTKMDEIVVQYPWVKQVPDLWTCWTTSLPDIAYRDRKFMGLQNRRHHPSPKYDWTDDGPRTPPRRIATSGIRNIRHTKDSDSLISQSTSPRQFLPVGTLRRKRAFQQLSDDAQPPDSKRRRLFIDSALQERISAWVKDCPTHPMDSLEWHWGLIKGSLHLDTRRNVFFVGASLYEFYKRHNWSLVPEEKGVRQFFYEGRRGPRTRRDFPKFQAQTFKYTFLPIKNMEDVYINRQSEDNTVTIYEYPFTGIPTITSHIHPTFVLLHLANALWRVETDRYNAIVKQYPWLDSMYDLHSSWFAELPDNADRNPTYMPLYQSQSLSTSQPNSEDDVSRTPSRRLRLLVPATPYRKRLDAERLNNPPSSTRVAPRERVSVHQKPIKRRNLFEGIASGEWGGEPDGAPLPGREVERHWTAFTPCKRSRRSIPPAQFFYEGRSRHRERSDFPNLQSETFKYKFLALDDMEDVCINRLSEDNTVTVHEYPFEDFPIITSHIHPTFVMLHLSNALMSILPDKSNAILKQYPWLEKVKTLRISRLSNLPGNAERNPTFMPSHQVQTTSTSLQNEDILHTPPRRIPVLIPRPSAAESLQKSDAEYRNFPPSSTRPAPRVPQMYRISGQKRELSEPTQDARPNKRRRLLTSMDLKRHDEHHEPEFLKWREGRVSSWVNNDPPVASPTKAELYLRRSTRVKKKPKRLY